MSIYLIDAELGKSFEHDITTNQYVVQKSDVDVDEFVHENSFRIRIPEQKLLNEIGSIVFWGVESYLQKLHPDMSMDVSTDIIERTFHIEDNGQRGQIYVGPSEFGDLLQTICEQLILLDIPNHNKVTFYEKTRKK